MAKRAAHIGPAKRREPVLDAALTVFSEAGFEAASMAAVAAEAGISKAVLYDVFPGGKNEMFEALLERGERQFMDHMAADVDTSGDDRATAITRRLDHFLVFAEVNPLVFRFVFGDVGTTVPEIARRHAKGRERIIQEMFGRAMAGMDVPDEYAEAVDLYLHLIVAVAEEMARWMLRHPHVGRETVVAFAAPFLLKGLDGVAPRAR